MRVAVLADIHANLPALEAAIEHVDSWKPDRVIVAGDVVNRGPRPVECLCRVEDLRARRGWRVIQGNHEEYVLREGSVRPDRPDWESKLCQHTAWTYRKIRQHLDLLTAWPSELREDGGLRCVHASLKGNRFGLYPFMTDATLGAMIDPAASVFCAGHTHVPFVRHLGGTLIVNAGAVGLPFDGDARACLAHLEHHHGTWHAEMIRLDYDRARAERDFVDCGYLAEGGPMVKLVLREFHGARARIGEWHRIFENLVAADHITIEDSVEEMLTSP
jgi:predicted phosphodiesterase